MSVEWAKQLLKEQQNNSKDYREIALLKVVGDYIDEQERRLESLHGQLEGKMWNPSRWR